jgi:hypothetical protein
MSPDEVKIGTLVTAVPDEHSHSPETPSSGSEKGTQKDGAVAVVEDWDFVVEDGDFVIEGWDLVVAVRDFTLVVEVILCAVVLLTDPVRTAPATTTPVDTISATVY